VGRSLRREDGSVFCSAINHWLESCRTHGHVLLSHLSLSQSGGSGSRISIPRKQGGTIVPPGTRLLLRPILRLAGLRWSYSNSPPHGINEVKDYKSSQVILDRRSAGQSVMVSGTHLGPATNFFSFPIFFF
jgi:hypothetical protein